MQLTGFQCRWPIGVVESDEFHFCAERAQPGHRWRYCVHHLSQALGRQSAAIADLV
jgi:hypothetical protein